jgi:uncharacterized YccA/Bax inhibitor family protein
VRQGVSSNRLLFVPETLTETGRLLPSSNPALNARTFENILVAREVDAPAMTLEGTAAKTGLLALLVALSALFTFVLLQTGYVGLLYPLMIVGFIGGFVFAFITIFKKNWAPVTAPIYALLEGLALGVISMLFEAYFPGIVFQATLLTFSVLGAMLLCYYTGLIKATENLKLGLFAAMGGIFLFYMIAMVMQFLGHRPPLIYDSGPFGIIFSLFVIGVAALTLVIDFDFIERGVDLRAPKYMEWYCAFGLMVTLIWLYLEILRLLAKTRNH